MPPPPKIAEVISIRLAVIVFDRRSWLSRSVKTSPPGPAKKSISRVERDT
jgi:hypothetical protein